MHPTPATSPVSRETNARVINNPVTLYAYAGSSLLDPIAEIPVGGELTLRGHQKSADGAKHFVASLPDGTSGYIPGWTKVFAFRKARLEQQEAGVYSQPSVESIEVTRYRIGQEFLITDVLDGDSGWCRIRSMDGCVEGFLDAEVAIDSQPWGGWMKNSNAGTFCLTDQERDELRRKDLKIGGLLLAFGLVVNWVLLSNSHSMGVLVVFWGPVVYGSWRLLRALFR